MFIFNKTIVFSRFFLLLLLVTSMGCKQQDIANKKTTIAIIVSTLNNPWFVYLAETAQAKAIELGHDARIFDSQNSTAIESDHFENILVSGYDAILFNSTDANGSVTNVLKAKAAGVPVFCMDREVNTSDGATSQILSDSYAGAVAIGRYFAQQLGKKGNYVELLGLVGDNNTWARSKGFHSVVDQYPGLTMVAQQNADFDRNKALEVMESIMQANPNIDAVFCGNDAMATGAYQALVSGGKAGQVLVFGFDGAEDVVRGIYEKKIAATGMQFPKVMAETAALFAHEFINGRRDFPKRLPVAVELVTLQNIGNYIAYGEK